MIKTAAILFVFLCTSSISPAQQNNNWYFGQRAGIRFSALPGQVIPVTLTDGAMITDEGSSSVSDSAGKLLFYTNGITVFNRLHQVMLNGDELKGNISSCQSAIIIPVPGNDSIYYIFTTDAIENNFSNGYNYSIVNMKRDNGNGEVVTKNTLLWQSCTERLTAARHQNGTDIWLITNDNNSNIFRSWLITCNGLQSNPVVSQAGVLLTQHLLTNTGYMKVSPDGKQLCQTHFPLFDPDVSNPNFVQLFDFNNTTGQVTNGRSVMFDNAMYVSCEYSSDSKMLYLVRPYERKVDQLEATLPSAAAVSASTISISTVAPVLTLQLAPDEKIYTFRPGQSLGVINYPAVKGSGCNFQDNQLDISPFSARFGSPSFINDVAFDPNNSFSYIITDSCSGRVQFTALSGMPGTLTWSWNFGDGNTSTLQNPVHTFTPANQSYTVTLNISSSVSCGNIKSSRQIKPSGIITDADFDFVTRCDSGYIRFVNKSRFDQNGGGQYLWDFGDGNSSTATNPVHIYNQEGLYSVKLKLLTGAACIDDSLTKQVEVKNFIVTAPPDQTISVGQPVFLSTNEPADNFQWSPDAWLSNSSIRNPVATPLEDIVYKVTASNGEGCKGEDSVRITVLQYDDIYVPTGFTPNDDGKNDILKPFYHGQVMLKEFSIYSRWGQRVFSTSQRNAGWNGKINGMLQQAGVYVWFIKAVGKSGETIERKGTFVLIR